MHNSGFTFGFVITAYFLLSSIPQKNYSFTNRLCTCGYFKHNRGDKQNNLFSLPNVYYFHKFQLKQSAFKGFCKRQQLRQIFSNTWEQPSFMFHIMYYCSVPTIFVWFAAILIWKWDDFFRGVSIQGDKILPTRSFPGLLDFMSSSQQWRP